MIKYFHIDESIPHLCPSNLEISDVYVTLNDVNVVNYVIILFWRVVCVTNEYFIMVVEAASYNKTLKINRIIETTHRLFEKN